MTSTPSAATARAEQALHEGDLEAALRHLQDGVRADPGGVQARIFLFQLLCVLGQWPRALAQLKVCGELDAATLPMVSTYREAIPCEALRAAVWAGRTTPLVFGQPEDWIARLVEALQAEGRGDPPAQAAALRAAAFEAAPASTGQVDGTPFDWIADADSRLGPVLEVIVNGRYGWLPFAALRELQIEPPVDLRDLVWAPARLVFGHGGDTVALLPTRYPGTAELTGAGTDALRLSRRTEWRALAGAHGRPSDSQYAGLGQRLLVIGGASSGAGDEAGGDANGDAIERGLLDIRQILFDAPPGAAAP